MNIIEYIKEKLGMGKLCPKHKIPWSYHGYYDLRYCEMCNLDSLMN